MTLDKIVDKARKDKIVDKVRKPLFRFLKAFYIALALYTASIPITCAVNRGIKEEEQTVVLVGGDNYIFENKVLGFLMYTPVTLKQNIQGNSVKWINNATKEEVIDYLQNPDYQNIVFIGHGSGSSFVASDGRFTAKDISKHDIPKKRGEFIQYTCGSKNQSLRHALLKNPENYYGFDGKVIGGIHLGTAWVRLFD